jgi:endoglucanase
MQKLFKILFGFWLVIVTQQLNAQPTNINMTFKGMNIAGAEFNPNRPSAKHFKDYIWPTNKNLEDMKALGFNTVRVPFAWERMQPNSFNALNEDEAKQLDRIIQQSHLIGLNVIIDPHSYGHYKEQELKVNQIGAKMFADFWARLAKRYGKYPNVIFGLMNEPYKQTAADWAKIAQLGVDAIRNTGASQLILVPGTIWSGMHSWQNKVGELSNAEALLTINDPLENYAYEMHQYFDSDSSGTHQECIAANIVINKFEKTTNWLKQNNKKALLGEFGVPENELCIQALKASLEYMSNNKNQWIGWAYWAAGDWMANYPFNIVVNIKPNLRLIRINEVLRHE